MAYELTSAYFHSSSFPRLDMLVKNKSPLALAWEPQAKTTTTIKKLREVSNSFVLLLLKF